MCKGPWYIRGFIVRPALDLNMCKARTSWVTPIKVWVNHVQGRMIHHRVFLPNRWQVWYNSQARVAFLHVFASRDPLWTIWTPFVTLWNWPTGRIKISWIPWIYRHGIVKLGQTIIVRDWSYFTNSPLYVAWQVSLYSCSILHIIFRNWSA